MDPNSRYLIANARIADRHAEASRARMLKGDPFADGVMVVGHKNDSPRLLGRLIGLKNAFGSRTGATSSASPAH